jgi:hypothetical protein
MKFRIDIEEGGEIPRGYGVAYRPWATRNGCVAMPIPLNLIVGAFRNGYAALVHGFAATSFDRKLLHARGSAWKAGYDAGQRVGLKVGTDLGYTAGKKAAFDGMLAQLDARKSA